jgi:glycosyltransferase involved in cell wall biosynthesis
MILTHHNIESKLMARRAPHEATRASRFYIGKQAERLAAYERLKCREYDMNIFMSEIDAAEMRDGIPDLKSTVIPNGVDVMYFQPKETLGDPPSLIYAGGMNMFANKDAVLYFLKEIWTHIRDAIPEVVFYAVGQDPPGELLEIASRDSQIRVTGYVDDVRPYISNACVYVVPLRIGGGTRLKVLDAMAMGKAIVSTSIGCEGIDISPGKNVILADDPRSFSDGTIDVIRNRVKRTNLGIEARKLVETRYSWDGIGRKLQRAYVEIASGKTHSENGI